MLAIAKEKLSPGYFHKYFFPHVTDELYLSPTLAQALWCKDRMCAAPSPRKLAAPAISPCE